MFKKPSGKWLSTSWLLSPLGKDRSPQHFYFGSEFLPEDLGNRSVVLTGGIQSPLSGSSDSGDSGYLLKALRVQLLSVDHRLRVQDKGHIDHHFIFQDF